MQSASKYMNLKGTREKIKDFEVISNANVGMLNGEIKEMQRQIRKNISVLEKKGIKMEVGALERKRSDLKRGNLDS